MRGDCVEAHKLRGCNYKLRYESIIKEQEKDNPESVSLILN
mgnify:CR=1 FL=1